MKKSFSSISQKSKAKIIKDTIGFVKNILGKEGTGHDWWHIERVLYTARTIGVKEKANMFVVELAVLLHDIGDYKVIGKPEDDYSIAENYLKSKHVPQEYIEQIMCIIKNMSFHIVGNSKSPNASLEFYVVQDADRLDALGAIGISRVLAFGGKKGRQIFAPIGNKKINFQNWKSFEDTSIRHFYQKLLLLKDLMNTKTGKNIARKRHAYMEKFLKEFFAEWEGRV